MKKKIPSVTIIIEDGYVAEVIKKGNVDVQIQRTEWEFYHGKTDTTTANNHG